MRFWKTGSSSLIGGILGIRGKAITRVPVDISESLAKEEGRWRIEWATAGAATGSGDVVQLRKEGLEKILLVPVPFLG